MKFDPVPVDAAEAAAQRAVYEPLTRAVRDLVDATIRTRAGADEVEAARHAIEAVTAGLRADQSDGPFGVRFTTEGEGMPWGNPVVGLRNPIAPPLVVSTDEQGRRVTDFELGAGYEGPPGHVHGGISALILDHILGDVASAGGDRAIFTGTITLKYLRGTPLGALRAEAWVERIEGIKTYARGTISDAQGPTVQADGVFIQPAWARE